jgi:glycosyltransferase involved in cell wall biosynthesis
MELVNQSVPISAVIPVKNGEKFLDNFLPQVIENLDVSDEIVIVNDRSTDRTESILKGWERRYEKIRVINNLDSGLISALNLGIKESSHDWIARFDVDDNYSANRIREQRMEISSKTVAIFSDYEVMGSAKLSLGTIYSPILPIACSLSLISSQRTAHPSSIFSKSAFEFVGGYRNQDFLIEDLSLWLRLSRVGNLVSVPQKLLKYSLNQNAVSMQNRLAMKRNSKQIISEIGINPVHLKQIEDLEFRNSIYNGIPEQQIRTLLFARDIFLNLTSRDKNKSRKLKAELIKDVIHNPFDYGVATKEILHGKILRDFYRRLPRR